MALDSDAANDVRYMRRALELAQMARLEGEIAVGAVIVRDGEIVGEGRNCRERGRDATAHAEIVAIRAACDRLNSRRLDGCCMYVTLEPCAMCCGAVINSRISRVVIAAPEPETGCCGSVCNLFAMRFSNCPVVVQGVLREESSRLLREAFREDIRRDSAEDE